MQDEPSRRLAIGGIEVLGGHRAHLSEILQPLKDYLVKQARAGEALKVGDARDLTWCAEDYGGTPIGDEVLFLGEMSELYLVPAPVRIDASWEEASCWLDRRYFSAYRVRCGCGQLIETMEVAKSFEEWLVSDYRRLIPRDKAGLNYFLAYTREPPMQSLSS